MIFFSYISSKYNISKQPFSPSLWQNSIWTTHMTNSKYKSAPCVDSALFMNLHFSALVIVELLPDGCLDQTTWRRDCQCEENLKRRKRALITFEVKSG